MARRGAKPLGFTGPIGRRWWETTSVEKSELLSALLAEQGIPHKPVERSRRTWSGRL